MHVITKKRLRDFWTRHPDAERPLRAWLGIVSRRRYADPHALKRDFPAASLLGRGITVFNVAGNRYRLVASMRYDLGRVYVRQVLTHAEYDRLAVEGGL